jgi:hypothetical protein
MRISFIAIGLAFVALAPFLWRVASDTAFPVSAEASLGWRIASIASASLGTLFVWAGVEFPNPWRRLWRFVGTSDNAMLMGTGLAAASLGGVNYFIIYERFALACWRGPFEWLSVLACPFYAILMLATGGCAIVLGILLYFGAVHHPILRWYGGNQREPRIEDSDEYP